MKKISLKLTDDEFKRLNDFRINRGGHYNSEILRTALYQYMGKWREKNTENERFKLIENRLYELEKAINGK